MEPNRGPTAWMSNSTSFSDLSRLLFLLIFLQSSMLFSVFASLGSARRLWKRLNIGRGSCGAHRHAAFSWSMDSFNAIFSRSDQFFASAFHPLLVLPVFSLLHLFHMHRPRNTFSSTQQYFSTNSASVRNQPYMYFRSWTPPLFRLIPYTHSSFSRFVSDAL